MKMTHALVYVLKMNETAENFPETLLSAEEFDALFANRDEYWTDNYGDELHVYSNDDDELLVSYQIE